MMAVLFEKKKDAGARCQQQMDGFTELSHWCITVGQVARRNSATFIRKNKTKHFRVQFRFKSKSSPLAMRHFTWPRFGPSNVIHTMNTNVQRVIILPNDEMDRHNEARSGAANERGCRDAQVNPRGD